MAEHKSPPQHLPGQNRFSLRENEERGGHILERHVGKTEEQLKQRLADEPHLKAVSSFHDESIAEQAIGRGIEEHQPAIQNWLRQRGDDDLPIQHRSANSIGIVQERIDEAARPSGTARIILRKDNHGGFYVRTAYLR